jgi:hypothetical protein
MKSLCFTCKAGWNLPASEAVPWGREEAGRGHMGGGKGNSSQVRAPSKRLFHGQSYTLAIMLALVTWISEKLQTASFQPFVRIHQQTETLWTDKNSSQLGNSHLLETISLKTQIQVQPS